MDVGACYNMSLKDFEHSGVHDLFKVSSCQSSKQFTDLLDKNYAAGFEDFRLDAVENFPNINFSVVKLNLGAATNSLLQTSSEDVNIEDDASTLPLPA